MLGRVQAVPGCSRSMLALDGESAGSVASPMPVMQRWASVGVLQAGRRTGASMLPSGQASVTSQCLWRSACRLDRAPTNRSVSSAIRVGMSVGRVYRSGSENGGKTWLRRCAIVVAERDEWNASSALGAARAVRTASSRAPGARARRSRRASTAAEAAGCEDEPRRWSRTR